MDRFYEKYHSKFSVFTDWVYFLVVINLLGLLMTLLGLVFFGLFPAWMTTYILIKKRIDQEEFPIFKTFIKTWKENIIKANVISYIMVVLWTIIVLSWLFYLNDLSTTLHWIGLAVIGFVAIALFLVTTYLPVSYAYFPSFKVFEHLKFSLLMALGMPKATVLMALNMITFYGFVLIRLITVFPFLAFSLPAFVNIIIARKKLRSIFTYFKDETVTALSLNAFPRHLDVWSYFQEHLSTGFQVSYEDFMSNTFDHPLYDGRLSMVLLDQKEAIKGFMFVLKEGMTSHLQLIYIDEAFRKRGYGKRMIKAYEDKAYQYGFDHIRLGHHQSFFEYVPSQYQRFIPFFKKSGYEIIKQEYGYAISKKLEVKEQ